MTCSPICNSFGTNSINLAKVHPEAKLENGRVVLAINDLTPEDLGSISIAELVTETIVRCERFASHALMLLLIAGTTNDTLDFQEGVLDGIRQGFAAADSLPAVEPSTHSATALAQESRPGVPAAPAVHVIAPTPTQPIAPVAPPVTSSATVTHAISTQKPLAPAVISVAKITGPIPTQRELSKDRSLTETEEQLRLTVERSPIGIALVSPDGRWLRVNDALCHFVDYSREQLLSIDFQSITHPDDIQPDLRRGRAGVFHLTAAGHHRTPQARARVARSIAAG